MSRTPQTDISATNLISNSIDGNKQTDANMLAEVRNGPVVARAARPRGVFTPVTGGRLGETPFGFVYTTSRQGSYTNYMACIPFDTSAIKVPPAKAQLVFGLRAFAATTNLAADHKFILSSIEGGQLPEAQAIDASVGTRTSYLRRLAAANFPIDERSDAALKSIPNSTESDIVFASGGKGCPLVEGFVSGSSFANSLRAYTDPQLVSSLSSGATITLTLNRKARLDIAKSNHFFVSFIDYSYFVLNRDPATVAPSAGANSAYVISLANVGGTHNVPGGQITTFGPPQLKLIAGEVGRGEREPKDKIDREFTINAYENLASQRVRYPREDGTVPDQVPFLLGTKGPLSLRGREFTEDGIPISSTVKPPNTSKS